MPRRIQAFMGLTPSDLKPLDTNDGTWQFVKTEYFEGRFAIHIKGFVDEDGVESDSPYFSCEDAKKVTWCIQVQGRMLRQISADDLTLGILFDEPLHIPPGGNPLLAFLKMLNPGFVDGLSDPQPWATAPIFSTATHLAHTKHPESEPLPPAPPRAEPISEGLQSLVEPYLSDPTPDDLAQFDNCRARRKWFAHPENRPAVQLTPSDVFSGEICYGRISFPEVSFKLPLGISVNLIRFVGNQPITVVVCRKHTGERPVDDDVLICGQLRFIDVDDEEPKE